MDDGILKISGLPSDAQNMLLHEVFPIGAQGVCGGLYDTRSGIIQAGHGKTWSAAAGSEISWSDFGLHGHHTVELDSLGGGTVDKVLRAIKDAAPDILGSFSPDSVRVAFENMHGRTIRPGHTLCGWSRDRDRVDDKDQNPKICIVLGSAKIWHSYKYRKEDRESLDVDLRPGDVLVLYGPSRSWVSAVNGFEPRKSLVEESPFDFAHIWLQDHRRLKRLRPEVYNSIHHPSTPVVGGAEYKWMQFAYTVSQCGTDGRMLVEISDGTSSKQGYSGSCDPRSSLGSSMEGRRWKSKVATNVNEFQDEYVQYAGA
jgi:hypothetical protein